MSRFPSGRWPDKVIPDWLIDVTKDAVDVYVLRSGPRFERIGLGLYPTLGWGT